MLGRGNTQLGDAAAHLETVIRATNTERSNQVSGAVAHFEKVVRAAEVSRIAPELADLNRNLISQNNRMIAQFEALAGRVNHLEELIISQTPRARVRAYQRVARHHLRRLADRARLRS
jgi:hypothetical protein